ncbi:MAG: hypothetical protein EXS48_03615 [Candidatus Staskawiczbacteria bacterium]|nr:hypothetical protein [Candidatus Staskawiczbacteria bacterium]
MEVSEMFFVFLMADLALIVAILIVWGVWCLIDKVLVFKRAHQGFENPGQGTYRVVVKHCLTRDGKEVTQSGIIHRNDDLEKAKEIAHYFFEGLARHAPWTVIEVRGPDEKLHDWMAAFIS